MFRVTTPSFGEIAGSPTPPRRPRGAGVRLRCRRDDAARPAVTGSGTVATDSSGGEGHFNHLAQTDKRGKVDYADSASGLYFASAFISSVTVAGTKATIKGTGFADATFMTFGVVVEDLRKPGVGSDTIAVSLGTGYARSGSLLRRNVQIR